MIIIDVNIKCCEYTFIYLGATSLGFFQKLKLAVASFLPAHSYLYQLVSVGTAGLGHGNGVVYACPDSCVVMQCTRVCHRF